MGEESYTNLSEKWDITIQQRIDLNYLYDHSIDIFLNLLIVLK